MSRGGPRSARQPRTCHRRRPALRASGHFRVGEKDPALVRTVPRPHVAADDSASLSPASPTGASPAAREPAASASRSEPPSVGRRAPRSSVLPHAAPDTLPRIRPSVAIRQPAWIVGSVIDTPRASREPASSGSHVRRHAPVRASIFRSERSERSLHAIQDSRTPSRCRARLNSARERRGRGEQPSLPVHSLPGVEKDATWAV